MHQNALAHTKHHPHKNAQHPAHSVGQGAAPSSGSRRALQTVPRTRHARCAARRRRRAASADQDTRMAQPWGDRRRLCQTETTSQPSGRAAPKRGQYRQVISTSTSTPPFVPPSPLGSHAPSRLSLGARGALALALGPLSSPLPVSWVPPPVPHALARPLTHLPSPCPLHLDSLPVPLRALPVPWPLPGPLP